MQKTITKLPFTINFTIDMIPYLMCPDLREFTALKELFEISLVCKGEYEKGVSFVIYAGRQDGVDIGVRQPLEEAGFTHD